MCIRKTIPNLLVSNFCHTQPCSFHFFSFPTIFSLAPTPVIKNDYSLNGKYSCIQETVIHVYSYSIFIYYQTLFCQIPPDILTNLYLLCIFQFQSVNCDAKVPLVACSLTLKFSKQQMHQKKVAREILLPWQQLIMLIPSLLLNQFK